MAGPQNWPDEHTALLKELYLRGDTASQIAAELARAFPRCGYSRNSVIGKRLRLGLPNRRDTVVTRKAAAAPAPKSPKPPKPVPHPLAVASGGPRHGMNPLGANGAAPKPLKPVRPDALTATARPWVEREAGQCKWPFTVEGETYSCCAPAADRYCPDHAALAFAPVQPRKNGLMKLAGLR